MDLRAFSFPLYLILTGLLLLPWIVLTFNMVGNADNLWLAEGYLRFSRGESLLQSFFEVNPPLSILLYAVPAEISAGFGVALHHTIFAYTLCAVGLASWVLYGLLKVFLFLSDEDRKVALIAFVFASTLMTTGFFGERDHFVAMALVLLSLIQLKLTLYGADHDNRTRVIAFVCSVLVLLKPHFLIIPLLILLHRACVRRNPFVIMRDTDFISLVLAVISYAALLFWQFQDYLFNILPTVVEYYGQLKAYDVISMMVLQHVAAAALFASLGFMMVVDVAVRRFVFFLIVISVVALVPYIIQGLGYAYHLIPATMFLWMALGIILYHAILKQGRGVSFSVVLSLMVCAAGAYAAKPPLRAFISHDEYAKRPLVQAAADCGHPDCSVFIFGPSFEISYLVSYYAQAQMASRFPTLFFLPRQLASPEGQEQQKALYRKMVVEDFKRYKPDTVMIASFEIVHGQGNFNFADYFSQLSDFRSEWQHYDFVEHVDASYDDYLKTIRTKQSVISFDIYRRRSH